MRSGNFIPARSASARQPLRFSPSTATTIRYPHHRRSCVSYTFHHDTPSSSHPPPTWLPRRPRLAPAGRQLRPVLRAASRRAPRTSSDDASPRPREPAMKNRQQWAAMLAKCVAPMDAPKASKAIVDMLPMLADFPDEAFCLGSLEAVATQWDSRPLYARELRGHLAEWWRRHRPTPTAIPPASQPRQAAPRRRPRNRPRCRRKLGKYHPQPQVRAKIRELDGNGMRQTLGHFLATAVAKHAFPYHLGTNAAPGGSCAAPSRETVPARMGSPLASLPPTFTPRGPA